MNRKFRRTTYGLLTIAFLMLGGFWSEPASAQIVMPQNCRLVKTPDSSTWQTTVQRFTCGAVETETVISLRWPCVPGPHCTPTPVFNTRSRRVSAPNINFARSYGTGNVCLLNPPTTAWTSWTVCGVGAPPRQLIIESLWVLVII